MTSVFGCAALGGLYRPVTREDAHAALRAAWDLGVRSFDTAPHYGVGQSEEYLGEFLRERPRDSFTVSTKVGRLLVADAPAVFTFHPAIVVLVDPRVVGYQVTSTDLWPGSMSPLTIDIAAP